MRLRYLLGGSAVAAVALACYKDFAGPTEPGTTDLRIANGVTVRETSRTAAQDSVRLSLTWGALSGAKQYGVRVTAPTWTVTTAAKVSTLTSSVTLSRATPWDSTTVTALVWGIGKGNKSLADTLVGTLVLRRVLPPSADTVLDALIIDPDSVRNLPYLAGQQFCTFWRMGNGKVAERTQDQIPCDPVYFSRFDSTTRAVPPGSQQWVDTKCVKWDATGGTITVANCDSVVVTS